MKKFLLITYYWPPAGGAGVQRWAKMSKYISGFGWQPVVYTPLDGEVPVYDESLLKEIPQDIEVIKTPIWEPYDLYKKFRGRNKKEKIYSGFIDENKKASLTQKISVFIRGNFFIPDARMFWIKPSVKFLKRYLKDHPVDAIVSTGPPHSMHMIAEKIHRITGIPWIADFRDPWTNIDFYKDLRLTSFADHKHRRLEQKVLKGASRIVVVTWTMRDEVVELCGRDDVEVVLNGFDDADFVQKASQLPDKEFTIVHVGSMNKDRNPVMLWQVLSELREESPTFKNDLRIKLIGPVDYSVRESVERTGLGDCTTFTEFLPHDEAVLIQQKTQLLLLIINNSPNAKLLIPGKLYEYLGSGRPILMIGPRNSDAARVLEITQGGVVHDFNEMEHLKSRILEMYAHYQAGTLKGNAQGIEKFTRRAMAQKFAETLDKSTGT